VSELSRRRRADADRSVAAILDAGAAVLAEDPHASLVQVATRAGLTRQTLYAHFSSRDALIEALVDRSTDRVIDALRAADLDRLPAGEALAELVRCGWQEIEATRFLLTVPMPAGAERDRERHVPVLRYLDAIVERGLRDGEFDPAFPAGWLAAATMALGHAAGDQVSAGTMTTEQARSTLGRTLTRAFSVPTRT
jgi:AcrR family transcriptional regulator